MEDTTEVQELRLASAAALSMPRLVVGMGTIDDYLPLVKAGADEVFCGYIPAAWAEAFGDLSPMNRREVLFTNVQIGSFSELEILKDMYQDCHVPITLTLNRPRYESLMLPFLKDYMDRCITLGFSHFIVADPALLKDGFHENGQNPPYYPQTQTPVFHLSGEYGELNHLVLDELTARCGTALKRIIFPRQTTIGEMEQMIGEMEKRGIRLEYEAFALNEKCHFTGAYCNSMHSDFFCHMCRLPYVPARMDAEGDPIVQNACEESASACPGDTGCGLCAFYRLRDIGVTHLKLVSRGNYTESTLEDVRLLRRALSILEQAENETAYIQKMKQELFPDGCSGNCYYR